MNVNDTAALHAPPAHAGTALLRLTEVEKVYGRTFVLRVDTLTVERGERLLVVGANGSGKSTLLRLIAGALVPTRGRTWRDPAWSSLRVGYVPQSGGLYGELSVADNFAIRRWLYNARGRCPRSVTPAAIVRRLGLESILETRPRVLSGGMHRLASLAAALQSEPDVLIVDEPFGDLDDRGVQAVSDLFEALVPELTAFIVAMPIEVPFLPVRRRLSVDSGRVLCDEP